MSDQSVSNHQSWLRAISIAKILFEDQGYHTKFLDEIEDEIKEKKGLYSGEGECREGVVCVELPKKRLRKNSVKQWPEDEKPHERMLKNDPGALTASQLIAILLWTGSEGKNVLDLAMEILRRYGNFRAMAEATIHELCDIKGVGPKKAAQIKAAFEIGKRVASYPLSKKRRILSSKDVYDVYRHYIQYFHGLKKEVFRLVMLDGKNRIFSDYTVSEGCLTSSIVHPREVYIQAIKNSAASVIFLHNHPSGDPSPSPEDIEITKRLVAAGELLGIKVLDHIVMGEGEYLSFADKGLL